jgi:hypothetical protein
VRGLHEDRLPRTRRSVRAAGGVGGHRVADHRPQSSTEIREAAIRHGLKTLREDGWVKVFNGMTSVEEVMRVTEESA